MTAADRALRPWRLWVAAAQVIVILVLVALLVVVLGQRAGFWDAAWLR